VPRRNLLIASLFGLALTARLVILAFRPGDLEAWEYETLASNVASGNGYVISRFGHAVLAFGDGNLYSFLAGTLYALVGHHPIILAVIQAVLASMAAPVLFAIAERPLGAAQATAGAALAALHPGLLAYTLKLHPLGLDVLLLSLFVFWTLQRQPGTRSTLMTGLTLGINLMSRPTYFMAGVAVLVARWIMRRSAWRSVAVAVLLAFLVGAPWMLRNWALLGEPLMASTSFEDVWKGNNIAANGSSYVAPGTTIFDVAPDALRTRMRQGDEIQLNAMFAEETLGFIQQRPGQFASLVARKFVYFWWLPQSAGTLYPSAWLMAYQSYAGVIFAFAAIGAMSILRDGGREERTLLSTVVLLGLVLAGLHALSYVEGRHRWGVEPLILLITARGMFAAATWLRPQSRLLRRVSDR
jgi:hypothetical protein